MPQRKYMGLALHLHHDHPGDPAAAAAATGDGFWTCFDDFIPPQPPVGAAPLQLTGREPAPAKQIAIATTTAPTTKDAPRAGSTARPSFTPALPRPTSRHRLSLVPGGAVPKRERCAVSPRHSQAVVRRGSQFPTLASPHPPEDLTPAIPDTGVAGSASVDAVAAILAGQVASTDDRVCADGPSPADLLRELLGDVDLCTDTKQRPEDAPPVVPRLVPDESEADLSCLLKQVQANHRRFESSLRRQRAKTVAGVSRGSCHHPSGFCVRKVPSGEGKFAWFEPHRPSEVVPRVVLMGKSKRVYVSQAKKSLVLGRGVISLQASDFIALENQFLSQTDDRHFIQLYELDGVVSTDSSGLPFTVNHVCQLGGNRLTKAMVVAASPFYASLGQEDYITVLDVVQILFPKIPLSRLFACFTEATQFDSAPLEKRYPSHIIAEMAVLFKWFDKRGIGRITRSIAADCLPDISFDEMQGLIGLGTPEVEARSPKGGGGGSAVGRRLSPKISSSRLPRSGTPRAAASRVAHVLLPEEGSDAGGETPAVRSRKPFSFEDFATMVRHNYRPWSSVYWPK